MPGISNPIAKAALPLVAAILLRTNAGSAIPIAIFPAPCIAGGKELSFHDKHGVSIQLDGLLLVNRSQTIRGLCCAPSNHVVQIRRGRARIPKEWIPASIWLLPNEFALGMTFAGMKSQPLYSLAILPPAAIPIPVVYPKEDRVFVIPLVPGYYVRQARIDEPYANLALTPPFRNGHTVLFPNSESPTMSHSYWDEVRQRLRRRFQPRPFRSGPDLRLNHYHYPRVKAFVLRELQRIEKMTKDPISAHAPSATESDQKP